MQLTHRQFHRALAPLLTGKGSVGKQGDVDTAEKTFGPLQHGLMGRQIVGIQRVRCDARATAHNEVRSDLREHRLVTPDQVERIAPGREQTFGRLGNRGRGTYDERSVHALSVAGPPPCTATSPWVTRRQKPEEKAGST